jgi:hypothetical protein
MGDNLGPKGLSRGCKVLCSIEVTEVVGHKADEPNAAVDFLNSKPLACQHGRDVDLFAVQADAPAGGDEDVAIMEGIGELPPRSRASRADTALISQNGNAYIEGLSKGWNPIQKYWREPTGANRPPLRDFLKPETTKFQYVHGVPDETLVVPQSYVLDSALVARLGNDEIQLDLFLDYASNVVLYPSFQEFIRIGRPPLLAV